MRPVVWSISYLLRPPLGISMVTSNSTGLVSRTPTRRPEEGSRHVRRPLFVVTGALVVLALAGGAAYVVSDRGAASRPPAAAGVATPRPPVLEPLPAVSPASRRAVAAALRH